MMTVMNSKRPNSIAKESIHFVASGNKANVLSGPIICPRAGPTLERDVKVPDKAVSKSNPNNDKINVKTPAEKKYNPIKRTPTT